MWTLSPGTRKPSASVEPPNGFLGYVGLKDLPKPYRCAPCAKIEAQAAEIAALREAVESAAEEISGMGIVFSDERVSYEEVQITRGWREEFLALPADRRPRVVWLQSGIRHDEAAARLTAAGIDVVQDACLGIYGSRYLPPPAG